MYPIFVPNVVAGNAIVIRPKHSDSISSVRSCTTAPQTFILLHRFNELVEGTNDYANDLLKQRRAVARLPIGVNTEENVFTRGNIINIGPIELMNLDKYNMTFMDIKRVLTIALQNKDERVCWVYLPCD